MCLVTQEYTVNKYNTVANFFTEPFNSIDAGIYEVRDLHTESMVIRTDAVKYKCYRLPYLDAHVAFIPCSR